MLGFAFFLWQGKLFPRQKDKRRHDVKIKILPSHLWFKAEVSQLCHTGPIQPTPGWQLRSCLHGPWVYMTVLDWGRWLVVTQGTKAPQNSSGPLIYRSRPMEQHSAFAPVLTTLPPQQELSEGGQLCIMPWADTILLWFIPWVIHSWISPNHMVRPSRDQGLWKGLEAVTRCARSCHGTIV